MLTKVFRQAQVPPELRQNFIHLYLDIAWFGVLSGSAVNFLSIYVTRLGATGFQVGLIAALSAVVNLILAIPAARWLEGRDTSRAIFWTSVLYRLGYLFWIPIPGLMPDAAQIWVLILITFLMAIPLTPLGVGFNALFAEAVPSDWRAHVAGIRNVTLAITFMATSLISGYILDNVAFPSGYQIVFAFGALGAALSSAHIFFIRPFRPEGASFAPPVRQPGSARSGAALGAVYEVLRLDIWQTRYRRVLLVLLGFHLAQYLALPIFPLYNVRVLDLTDDHIGTGTSLFYLTVLIGSTRFGPAVQRLGHRTVTGWGVVGMGLYPLLLAFTTRVWQFYAISLLAGFTWAMAGGAFANYMLEHIPAYDRPPHLAWYNIVLNGAILIGSLSGPLIAQQLGLGTALITFGLLRFLAGFAILRWG